MATKAVREKAQEIMLSYVLDSIEFWQEREESRGQHYTETQAVEMQAEVRKQAARLAKLLGYELKG